MENKKTISYLNSKVWYRFLKVIFIVTFLLFLLGSNLIFVSVSWIYHSGPSSLTDPFAGNFNGYSTFDFSSFIQLFIIGNFVTSLIFEAIRRAFYYIVFGSIKPEK